MSKAIQCDICGGFDGESRGRIQLNKLEGIFPSWSSTITVELKILESATTDLCKECRNKILQELALQFTGEPEFKPKGK